MTDYNDGKWHAWDGGQCPVHPKTTVEYVWHDPTRDSAGFGTERQAVEDGSPILAWPHVVKFRVVKEHKEPREFWVDPDRCIAVTQYHAGFILVREVLE